MASTTITSLIPARLERLPMSRYHAWIYILCAAGVLFGSADIFTIFSVGVKIQETFGLSAFWLATVIGSAAPAGMAGAFVAGRLGDSYGRKFIFQYTLLLYFIGSIIAGISGYIPNFWVYLIGRLILGFGVGGELPTILALISEYMPRRVRGPLLVLINGMYAIGALLAGNLSLYIVPRYSWEPLYFILAVPALIVLLLRRVGLPESARWLEAKGRKDEAEKIVAGLEAAIQRRSKKPLPPVDPSAAVTVIQQRAPLREVFSGRFLWYSLLLMWAWWITSFAGIVLPAYYIPILQNNFHYTYEEALKLFAYTVDANAVGVVVALLTVEYVGRKPMLVTTYLLYGLFAILVGLTLGNKQLLPYTIVPLNVFIVWNFSMILAYTPEVYPTRNRSTGNAVSTTSYNFSQFISPYIIAFALPLLPGESVRLLFYIEGILLILTAIPFIWVQETKRKSLEEIAV